MPVVVLPPLLTITKHTTQIVRKDHKKLLRLLYYHIQLLLGCGRAGTNGPKDTDDSVSATVLPPHVLSDFWQTFSQPTKDIAQIVACLLVLAGILRGLQQSPAKNRQKAQQGRLDI